MGEFKRFYALLRMIAALRQPGGYTVLRLSGLYGVTTRSIYRYLDLLKECGFNVQKFGARYRILSKEDDWHVPHQLSDEELGLLAEALTGVHQSNPLKTGILQKLAMLTNISQVTDLIVNAALSVNIAKISEAIKNGKQVILHQYHSPNSKTVRDRLVEPLRFGPNLRYLYAWDVEHARISQFKPERVAEVTVTNIDATQVNHDGFSEADVFGMNGFPRCEVTLRCSQRAVLLLMEEYVLPDIEPPAQGKTIEIRLNVHGFEGVGRFVLGLPGEVEPLGPKQFSDYLKQMIGRNTWLARERKIVKV